MGHDGSIGGWHPKALQKRTAMKPTTNTQRGGPLNELVETSPPVAR